MPEIELTYEEREKFGDWCTDIADKCDEEHLDLEAAAFEFVADVLEGGKVLRWQNGDRLQWNEKQKT